MAHTTQKYALANTYKLYTLYHMHVLKPLQQKQAEKVKGVKVEGNSHKRDR